MNAILNPALLIFLGGILFGLITKKLFPDVLSKYLGYYLLLSLGLKGGISLETTGFINDVVNVLSIGIFLAVLIPLLAYIYLRNILNTEDASALAGTYGSVSAVTFVTAINFLSNSSQQFDDYMSAVLVVMEFPAIFMALFLFTRKSKERGSKLETAKKAFLEIPNIILVGSLVISYLFNFSQFSQINLITESLFDYILLSFLFVMGTRVAKRLGELKGRSQNLILFALITPIISSALALIASVYFSLDSGNATLIMVLAASASYIAVPAVVKDAIPNANPAIYLGLSLGITFPFNIIFGIPIYNELAKYFIG
tara:strand:+ start:2285 stop:3223 length:939 start_codon:yes stop_codon:yes gene_type:complete